MKKILFSACCNTYTQQKACEGLIKLLKDNSYQVDMANDINREIWTSYNLAFAFNKRGYQKIQEIHPAIPIIYSVLADDYEKEFIENSVNQYDHLLIIAPNKPCSCTDDSTTTMHFPCFEEMNAFPKYRHSTPSILVGAGNGHSALRLFIILNTLNDYKVNIIYSGEEELFGIGYAPHVIVREEFEVNSLIQEANIIVVHKYIALQGALQKKPVIVVGDCGSGGLLTSNNVLEQYHNRFAGQIGGEKDAYFSLDQFQKDIKAASKISSRELEAIALKLKNEMSENNKRVLNVVSSHLHF